MMIKKINIISLIIVLIVLTSCIKEEQIGTVVQKKLTLTTKDETIIKATLSIIILLWERVDDD